MLLQGDSNSFSYTFEPNKYFINCFLTDKQPLAFVESLDKQQTTLLSTKN